VQLAVINIIPAELLGF